MDGWTPVYHGDKAAPLPVEVTAHLLDKEGLADALAADSIGQTVLHLAALAGDTATVKEVVQRSTNKAALLNLETKEGNTPLHYAAMSEDTAVLLQLLRAGANMAAKNKYGNLPLHLSEAAGNAAGYPL